MFLVSSCTCLHPNLEARCAIENEDVVGAAPAGDAPTTSEWSTILLPTKVQFILDVWQYVIAWDVNPSGVEARILQEN